ncbi:pyruvate kinase [Zavarzinia compransoris]|uniref:pyruvate kinase n=1 Tax=Zavarzinia marina TaxID=2911065 RepID=UPI001EEF5C64|nr:pyruvate kinase [Zavarzinia marina]MCF4166171.1 pyruvate kinase [Zavarzinia marina]
MTRYRNRRARIIATLGPASSDKATIRALFDAGADVFRLNMSHGDHEDARARHAAIREVEAEVGRPIGILADLQGPKLRIGRFAQGSVEVRPGHVIALDMDETPGDDSRVCLPHPEIFAAMVPGTELLLDDGRVKLAIDSVSDGKRAVAHVIEGRRLSDRKGVNVPNAILPLAAMTPKDLRDLDFVLGLGVDWVALSFVQRAEDVTELKAIVQGRAGVLAKIEKPSAVERIDDILAEADAIMVARGDLGVELPLETVPGIQKRLTAKARAAGKPVVVATQMLESMVTAPVPTRAEVSDVATAVYDGADAVMLSAESAAGGYPLEAVATMSRIADQAENDIVYDDLIHAQIQAAGESIADAISAAACQVAGTVAASCIVSFTSSGATALRVARKRPDTDILVLTPVLATARRLTLAWGLHCVVTEDVSSFAEMVQRAGNNAVEHEFARPGDRIVITAGVPFGTSGATNILRVATAPEPGQRTV